MIEREEPRNTRSAERRSPHALPRAHLANTRRERAGEAPALPGWRAPPSLRPFGSEVTLSCAPHGSNAREAAFFHSTRRRARSDAPYQCVHSWFKARLRAFVPGRRLLAWGQSVDVVRP